MKATKELIEKFEIGDPLTDAEVRVLFDFYTELANGLYLLGATYRLAWLPVHLNSERLYSYLLARGRKV